MCSDSGHALIGFIALAASLLYGTYRAVEFVRGRLLIATEPTRRLRPNASRERRICARSGAFVGAFACRTDRVDERHADQRAGDRVEPGP